MEIKLFAEGKHDNGTNLVWTKSDLDVLVENTKQKNQDVPIVPFHPVDNLPILGWIDINSLKTIFENKRKYIVAKIKKISENAKNYLKRNGIDKVSIAIDPESLTIEHVGLVDEPAVAGLGVAFSKTNLKQLTFKLNRRIKFMTQEELMAKIEEIEARISTIEAKIAEWEAEEETVSEEPVSEEPIVAQKFSKYFNKKASEILKKIYSGKVEEEDLKALKDSVQLQKNIEEDFEFEKVTPRTLREKVEMKLREKLKN